MKDILEFNCRIGIETDHEVTVELAKFKGRSVIFRKSWCSFTKRPPPRDPMHRQAAAKYPMVLRIPRVFAVEAGIAR